ncbi:MAG: tetratricopeptide repeat protein [Candidatus Zixiibacteriota bacterium]
MELLFEGSEFCEHCGVKLDREALKASEPPAGDDDLDFVVTEGHEDYSQHVVGNKKEKSEDLGLQSSAEIMEHISDTDQRTAPTSPSVPSASGTQPIQITPGSVPATSGTAVKQPGPDDTGGLRRLSVDEVKAIEKNLYSGSSSYLSEDEKRNLLKNMSSIEQAAKAPDSAAIARKQAVSAALNGGVSPTSKEATGEFPKAPVAKRGRGVAFFFKNYIRLQGHLELHDHDELLINERVFVLRKKNFSPKVTFSVAAGVFTLVLLVLASQFLTGKGSGKGEVVGFILDEQMQPYLSGATVRFPDLGKKYTSNSQGFFKTDPLPPGSHKIEYALPDGRVAVDYATVVGGDITTLVLRSEPAGEQEIAAEIEPTQSAPVTTRPARERDRQTEAPPQQPANVVPEVTRANARVTLAANVEGARLVIDNTVLGAGNLTYGRLKPGNHQYSVSKEGYQTATGTIDLTGGETAVLAVTLSPSQQKPAAPQLNPSEQAYNDGQTAMNAQNYAAAIGSFSTAIEQNANYIAAYMARAKAYAATGQKQAAHDDFLKSAEMYRMKKNYDQAVQAYNKAIEANPKSGAAYLGRADLYLDKGEEIAAIADYETVTRLDRRNPQAYMGLGEARFNQGNFEKAIKYFKDAKDLDPNNAEVYEHLMLSYLANGDIKDVKKTYEKYKSIASPEAQNRLARDNRFSAVMSLVGNE